MATRFPGVRPMFAALPASAAFPDLAALLRNDPGKIRLMARVFHRAVALDLQLLDEAMAAHQWTLVRDLAERIRLGCLQMCESNAARSAAALAHLRDAESQDYARHRAEIVDLLNRAEACAHNVPEDDASTTHARFR